MTVTSQRPREAVADTVIGTTSAVGLATMMFAVSTVTPAQKLTEKLVLGSVTHMVLKPAMVIQCWRPTKTGPERRR